MTRQAGFITTVELRDLLRRSVQNESELLEVVQALMDSFPRGSFAYNALDDFSLNLEGYIYYGDEDGSAN